MRVSEGVIVGGQEGGVEGGFDWDRKETLWVHVSSQN